MNNHSNIERIHGMINNNIPLTIMKDTGQILVYQLMPQKKKFIQGIGQ